MVSAIIYFSYTGNTEAVARRLAQELGVPLVPLQPRRPLGKTPISILHAMWVTVRRRALAVMEPAEPLPEAGSDNGLTILGGPIWGGRLHPLLRGWLGEHPEYSARPYALFSTSASSGPERMAGEVEEMLGHPPIAVLNVSDEDRADGRSEQKYEAFIRALVG